MNDKTTYHRWAGVLLGILLNGSAHFLSGKRSTGVKWFFGLYILGLIGIALIATPGTATYVLGLTFLLASFVLWLVMLKQSYRPIQRIGFLGWLAVIVLAVVINSGADYLVRQFILPFKMPSGSMQPTIHGIHADAIGNPSIAQRLISGQRYLEIKAENSGVLSGPRPFCETPARWTYTVGPRSYELPRFAPPLKQPGEQVSAGDVLWSGVITGGDHLFVERLSYRFGNPKRGDVVVFKTDGIDGARSGSFFIKRITGLPGECIRIDPPHLIVNDQKVMEPEIFNIISSKTNGYSGFLLALDGQGIKTKLATTNDVITLGENEYFVTGDNSLNSLDCRYFDPVPRKNIIGKVTRIYYPFTRINKLK
ncbi:MAG: signal peptidase I [Kiritimatiellae bacterium]|jgi:signal peptidase I|nr:signal peptidase I [Kiritimatiellia bacterium]